MFDLLKIPDSRGGTNNFLQVSSMSQVIILKSQVKSQLNTGKSQVKTGKFQLKSEQRLKFKFQITSSLFLSFLKTMLQLYAQCKL